MSVEVLLKAVFISTVVFADGAQLPDNLTLGTTECSKIVETAGLSTKDTPENVGTTWTQTQKPNKHERIKRGHKNKGTTEKSMPDLSKMTGSENLGSIFEKIKLRMELQRKKRENEMGLQNDNIPKITLQNEDKELDATKWLKNWKDILAVNPILNSERPTRPEVDFIDEWKYSYRVTMYIPGTYNVSNFVCSGLMVSSQWVLTSVFCNLGDDVTLLIGVHTLPVNISKHNKYGILQKVYSPSNDLEIIQMDRPVQWIFKAPDIRTVDMEEMGILLRRGKCHLLSWIPVDLEKSIFELRQYPQLELQSEGNPKENRLKASSVQRYSLSKGDIGSPVLCDGILTGILLDEDMTVELLCPVLEWVNFFTRERSYFEVTARKFTLRSGVERLFKECLLVHLLAVCLVWMAG